MLSVKLRMMLSVILLLIILILSTTMVPAADDTYQRESLDLKLDVDGGFDLTAAKTGAKLKEVSANLLLYPKDDYRQNVLSFNSQGAIEDGSVNFFWNDQVIESKEFGYSALIRTGNFRKEVAEKITFPLILTEEEQDEVSRYLLSTESIDSDNPTIVNMASELVEGEDDLFKAVFLLASWVEENVEYDLNTLTETASQKASWVLENKQGVCDEISSLFIAMARAVGIPARFVSGISYTTSELFDENWQPHGWAEVYFPSVGWVSFDITFGEYGYIDVTHIKLRDGFDPTDSAVKYEWLADGVTLDSRELNLDVKIAGKGDLAQPEIELEQEITDEEVGFGSYNLIKGIIKNNENVRQWGVSNQKQING